MNPEEPDFSDTQGHSDFILLPSQDETQDQVSDEDVMRKMLISLPALQGKSSPPKRKSILADMSSTDDERKKGAADVVLVPDSEYDGGHATDRTTASEVISDSEVEDEDITIIQAGPKPQVRDDDPVQSPVKPDKSSDKESGSSFDDKNRSGIGSYDTCEVYKTQTGHVKGYRKTIFPSSQEDMFPDTEKDESIRGPVLTPSEHLGSLQISQNPILVPETVDEIGQIPPSQSVYGSTPIIVPSTPTTQESQEDSVSDEKSDIETDKKQDKESDCQDANTNRPVEVGSNPDSLYLHLSISTTANSEAVIIKDSESEKTEEVNPPRSRETTSRTSPPQDAGQDEDVIVIESNTLQSQPDDDSDLSLYLSPTQANPTQGQDHSRHQSGDGKSQQQTQNKDSGNGECFDILGQATLKSDEVPRSDQGSRSLGPAKRGHSFSLEERRVGVEVVPDRQVKSQDTGGVGRPDNGGRREVTGRYDSKMRQKISELNQNPLVVWKDESDTERKIEEGRASKLSASERLSGEFHLSLPKPGTSVNTENDDDERKDQRKAVVATDNTSHLPLEVLEQSSKQPWVMSGKLTTDTPSEQGDTGKGVHLSMGLIGLDSEPLTEPVFRLEKPDMMSEVALVESQKEPVVTRSPVRTCVQRYLPDDDSDDEVILSKKVPSQEPKTSDQQGRSLTREESEEEILIAQKVQVPQVFAENTLSHDPIHDKRDSELVTMETEEVVKETVPSTSGDDLSVPQSTKDNVVKEKSLEAAPMSRQDSTLSESSAQNKVIEELAGVDVSVVQKVAEYLVSGYSPVSRASSTCTDISDQHGDFQERGEGAPQTPLRAPGADVKKTVKTPRSRRASTMSTDKSPQEIKDILNCYTSILNKKHKHRRKSLEDDSHLPSSQMPNPAGRREREKSTPLIPRRLSTHSLPTETVKSPTVAVPFAASADAWMSARKPVIQTEASKTEASISSKDLPKIGNITTDKSPPRSQNTVVQVTDRETESKSSDPKTSEHSRLTGGTQVLLSNKSSVSHGMENELFMTGNKTSDTQEVGSNKISLKESKTLIISPSEAGEQQQKVTPQRQTSTRSAGSLHRSRHKSSKHKTKKLLTPSARNSRRQSTDSSSPVRSGSFVQGTQVFQPAERSQTAGKSRSDPYTFHGTQSSPEKVPDVPNTSDGVSGKHLKSATKRNIVQSGSRRMSDPSVTPAKRSVSFTSITSPPIDQPVSQFSDVTVTTIGSLQSIPSTISQSSGAREHLLSPSSSSSSSRQTATQEISSRLSGKRLSLEPALPDTIPLHHSEEDNYQQVTIVMETVETLYREISTTRRVINAQGEVLESSVDVKKLDPVIVEENTHKRVHYVYVPSPSRSAASLTSGDLADISSSLSRTSASSSMGSKVNSLTSSGLDHTDTVTRLVESQADTGGVKGDAMATGSGEEGSSRLHTSHPTDTTAHDVASRAIKHLSISEPSTSKPTTPVVQGMSVLSDQEASDVQTPLGSTINKTGSFHLHSRTASMESPKTSDSLFTSSGEHRRQHNKGEVTRPRTPPPSTSRGNRNVVEADSSSGTGEAGSQDKLISSPTDVENMRLVPSSGEIGCRVIARWKDGFYYPGTLKSSEDRFFKCHVKFDDGDSMNVKTSDILLIERLPVGQSVLVLSEEGDFESGIILRQQEDTYMVDTDSGATDLYPLSQVILTGDQAQCIITDHGNQVTKQLPGQPGHNQANVGDVTLDNLVDAPRRSAKKQAVVKATVSSEDSKPPSSSRGHKRKLESLKPQATSTPTPNRGRERQIKRRRVEGLFKESSEETEDHSGQTSTRKSPRKARVDLFNQKLGPLPPKKVFKGLTFLLTNVVKSPEQREQEKSLLKDSSLETSTDESATDDDETVQFDKEHLQAQIEAGGGQVIETLQLNTDVSGKKCFLVSSSYQRTIKYLQCLARGVPCLSHMWIIDSCTQGTLLDTKAYTLPAGISLEKKRIMEWRGKTGLFRNIKAVVHSSQEMFIKSWSTILQLGECNVSTQLRYTDINVIVTDTSCSGTVERKAKASQVPLVSSEWVIQCLVNGRIMSYHGLSSYKHDYLT